MPSAILAFFAVAMAVGGLLVAKLIRPSRPSALKSTPYECGELPQGEAWSNFNVRFYVVSLIFIIFDVEAALMFPVAAIFKRFKAVGMESIVLFSLLLFIGVLAVGVAYCWKKGDLDWVKSVRQGSGMNSTVVTYLQEIFGFEAGGLGGLRPVLWGLWGHRGFLSLVGGLGTYAERKISADIQMRQGPNRVGPYGLLQFIADGIKMLSKEDIFPAGADRFLFALAPVLALLGVLMAVAVLPFSEGLTLSHLNVGVLYLIGVSSLVGVAVFLGGYASNSKWSMLGGMRGASQYHQL